MAESVDQALSGKKIASTSCSGASTTSGGSAHISKEKMTRAAMLPVNARKSNFMEINLGYTGEQARIEANRCLRCDVRDHKREPRGIPVSE